MTQNPISHRWSFPFAFILIGLVVGGVGGFALYNLHQTNHTTQHMYAGSVSQLDLIGELQYQTQEARRSVQYALTTTDANLQMEYVDQSRAADAYVAALHDQLQARSHTPQLDQLREQFHHDWAAYLEVRNRVSALILEGNSTEAIALDQREGEPAFTHARNDLQEIKISYKAQAEQQVTQVEKISFRTLVELGIILCLTQLFAAFAVKMVQKGQMLHAVQQSEARLHDVIESIDEGMFVVDRAGNIALWNQAAERSMERSRDQVLGHPLLHAFPEVTVTALQRLINDALASGQARAFEALPLAYGRDIREFATRAFPFEGGTTVFLRDVTENRRAEQALHQSEKRFRSLIENSSDIITIFDGDGVIQYESPSIKRILGYDPEEPLGRRPTDIIHPDDLASVEEAFSTLEKTEGPLSLEFRVRHKDGSWRVLEGTGKNLLRDTAVAGIVFNSRDVTERKEIERLKDELVSTVSHELRTPLTSLRGFAELMLKRDYPLEKQRTFLTVIHTEATRLTTLINDFLDIQRMESGRQTYSFFPLDCTPLFREVLTIFTTEDTKHTFSLNAEEFLPLVSADADRLRQVLTNLLSNAIKYTPQGGQVSIGARRDGDAVCISITDQGIGISPEALPRLFSKFYRVDNTATRNIGGTGLGLALVKEIIEAHNGRIWVDSQVGHGSTFSFTLPIAALDHADDGAAIEQSPQSSDSTLL